MTNRMKSFDSVTQERVQSWLQQELDFRFVPTHWEQKLVLTTRIHGYYYKNGDLKQITVDVETKKLKRKVMEWIELERIKMESMLKQEVDLMEKFLYE